MWLLGGLAWFVIGLALALLVSAIVRHGGSTL
jgi:hypothetical protein